jgi:hypothetical protein
VRLQILTLSFGADLPVKFTLDRQLALLAILLDSADGAHFSEVIDDLYLSLLPLLSIDAIIYPVNLALVILYVMDTGLQPGVFKFDPGGKLIVLIRYYRYLAEAMSEIELKNQIKELNSGAYMSRAEMLVHYYFDLILMIRPLWHDILTTRP